MIAGWIVERVYLVEAEYSLVFTGPFATQDEAVAYMNALPDEDDLVDCSVSTLNAPDKEVMPD